MQPAVKLRVHFESNAREPPCLQASGLQRVAAVCAAAPQDVVPWDRCLHPRQGQADRRKPGARVLPTACRLLLCGWMYDVTP